MKISVCMATFNGERFLPEQLGSILSQMEPGDEVLISDDASTDATCAIVEALHDSRVQLLRNKTRLGYVGNFERALRHARGDIVLLSDQDDIWAPHKMAHMRQAFLQYPHIGVVHHDFDLIDEIGAPLGRNVSLEPGIRKGWPLVAREFVKATLWGCAMGMRSRIVQDMLPFPGSVYAHDHWATIVGALRGGILFLPEALISHRLHGRNLTPKKGLAWQKRLQVRLKFLDMAVRAANLPIPCQNEPLQ